MGSMAGGWGWVQKSLRKELKVQDPNKNSQQTRAHTQQEHGKHTNLRPSASEGLLAIIDPSQAPAMSSEVATSCCTVGKLRSRRAEPVGQVASSPERQALGPPSPATSTVLRAERQYLYCVVLLSLLFCFCVRRVRCCFFGGGAYHTYIDAPTN